MEAQSGWLLSIWVFHPMASWLAKHSGRLGACLPKYDKMPKRVTNQGAFAPVSVLQNLVWIKICDLIKFHYQIKSIFVWISICKLKSLTIYFPNIRNLTCLRLYTKFAHSVMQPRSQLALPEGEVSRPYLRVLFIGLVHIRTLQPSIVTLKTVAIAEYQLITWYFYYLCVIFFTSPL